MSSTRSLVQSPVLVGRDETLAVIDRKITDAAVRHGSAILLAGEAGIGKSRIVRTLLLRAIKNGFRYSKSDLNPQDQFVSLASINDLARCMTERDLVPAWGDLGTRILAVQGGKGGDSLSSRRILVHELANLIAEAIEVPTVLAFEDLHWADELTLEIVGELARLASDRPLLVVATYRPEDLPVGSIHREWISRLLTQRLATSVALDRLTAEETAQATTLILGTGLPAPRDVAEAVHRRTNGIPLHIEELLAAIDGETADGRAIRDAGVPATIEDAVLARLRRLSADAQLVARASSVMGRCFAPEVLAAVLDRPVSTLDDAIDELVGASILLPYSFIDEGYFDYRHQLLRDAIYASVPRSELRRMHARTAEFCDSLIGVVEVHKAIHYERAGLRAEAFRAALAGATAAAAVSSRYEAFELYQRAAANIPPDLTNEEEAALWTGYASAAFAIDDVRAIELGTSNARRLYVELDMGVDAAMSLLDLTNVARRDMHPRSERIALLEQVDAELAALPPSQDRTFVLAFLRYVQGLTELDGGRMAEARRLLQASNAIGSELPADHADRGALRLNVDVLMAMADALEGRVDEALPRMLDLSRQSRDAGFEGPGVTNYRMTADVAARLMEYPRSLVGLTEGLRYADAVEQSYCRHVMSATSALIDWASGAWDGALQRAELELVQHGSRRGTIGSRAAIAFVSFGRGDIERARALLDASLAITRPGGECDLILPALWGHAETALVDGDPARALDHCWEAAELAEPTGERALLVPFVVTGVRAALLHRRPELAQKWLDRIASMLTAWPDLARPALEHAEGLIRTASGSTVSARTSLEAAVRGWDARGRIWEATWARLDLAAALARGNRHAEARPILTEVLSTARRLGSLPLLRRAEELERSARGHAGEQEPWHPLSTREYEVARAIADGLTNGEIASQLVVSPKTVSAHVEHILDKLGMSRRTEVAAWVASVERPGVKVPAANR
jgi:DNA-binding CsgD family transcriptional regulator